MDLTVELVLPALGTPAVAQARQVAAGQDDWKFFSEREENEMYYRTKMQGTFKLSGDDFAWLYQQSQRFACCVEVEINVFRPQCDGTGDELFWPGYFSIDSVEWDFYACSGTVKEIKTRDSYDALYRVWETKINLIEGDPIRTPFVALYLDYYTFQPNAQGQLVEMLPDGNAPGTGRTGLEHVYTQGLDFSRVCSFLWQRSIYGTAAGFIRGIASEFLFLSINPVTGLLNPDRILMAGSDAKRPASITPAVNLYLTVKEFLTMMKGIYNAYYYIDSTGLLKIEHYSYFEEKSYKRTGLVTLDLTKYPDALEKANNESVNLDELYGYEEIVITNNPIAGVYKTGNVTYNEVCTVKDDKGEVKKNSISIDRIFTDLYGAYIENDSVPDDSIFLAEVSLAYRHIDTVSPLPEISIGDPADYNTLNALNGLTLDPISMNIGPLYGLNAQAINNFVGRFVPTYINGTVSAAALFRQYHRHGRSYTTGLVNSYEVDKNIFSAGQPMAMLSTRQTRQQKNIAISVCCDDLPLNVDAYIKTNRFTNGKLISATFEPKTDTVTLIVAAGSRCDDSIEVVEPPKPQDGNPQNGDSLGTTIEFTYCADGLTVATSSLVEYFADGNGGKRRVVISTTTVYKC